MQEGRRQKAEGRSNIACTVSLLANVQRDSYFRRAALVSRTVEISIIGFSDWAGKPYPAINSQSPKLNGDDQRLNTAIPPWVTLSQDGMGALSVFYVDIAASTTHNRLRKLSTSLVIAKWRKRQNSTPVMSFTYKHRPYI